MILEHRGNIIVVPHITYVEVLKNSNKIYLKHTQDKQMLEFSSSQELDSFVSDLKKAIKSYYSGE